MTSFSIDSILALRETKCGTAQANGIHKNKIEELRDEDISSTKFRDHRSSPNSSPAELEMEEPSYEGNIYAIFYFICEMFAKFVTYWQIYFSLLLSTCYV